MDARRLLPLSGLVFVVVALVAIVGFGGDTPETDSSGSAVAAFYGDDDGRQAMGAFLLAASIPFLVFFAVSLATAAGVWRAWEYVLVGGSVLLGATLALLSVVWFALTDGATNDASPAALQALNLIDGNGWVAFNAAFGVMMLGAAGCLISRPRSNSRGTYRWLGWIALILGIALFIPYADFIALVLTLVWIIVVSVMLFRDTQATGSEISAAAVAG